ncbi:MAG: hypothetical protein ACREBU_15800 [Nitrososphaera sp.]
MSEFARSSAAALCINSIRRHARNDDLDSSRTALSIAWRSTANFAATSGKDSFGLAVRNSAIADRVADQLRDIFLFQLEGVTV